MNTTGNCKKIIHRQNRSDIGTTGHIPVPDKIKELHVKIQSINEQQKYDQEIMNTVETMKNYMDTKNNLHVHICPIILLTLCILITSYKSEINRLVKEFAHDLFVNLK
jgi:membrane protein insertase Oxa1/YidC/SpoIIIJ